jgi:Sigma-70 region 2
MPGRAQRPPTEVAVEHLYRQHGHVVLRRARALVDDEEARDVVQEVFMALLADPDQFGGSQLGHHLAVCGDHARLSEPPAQPAHARAAPPRKGGGRVGARRSDRSVR